MLLLLPQRAQENQTYLVRAFTCDNNKTSEHCNIRENGSIVERIYHCNKEKKTADKALSVLLNQRARRYS